MIYEDEHITFVRKAYFPLLDWTVLSDVEDISIKAHSFAPRLLTVPTM